MSHLIQIRNVSEETHRRIKARAALAGMTLSDYLRREIERILRHPTREELEARLRTRTSVELEPGAASVLERERAERDPLLARPTERGDA